MLNKKIEKLLAVLLILLIILVFTKIQYIFKPIFEIIGMFLGPIIIAGFIYYWLRPVTRFFTQGKLNKFRGPVAGLSLLLFIGILGLIISMSGVKLSHQLQDSIKQLTSSKSTYFETLEEGLGKFNLDLDFFKKYIETGKDLVKNSLSNLPGLFSGIGDFTSQLILIPFMVFYLLKEEEEVSYQLKSRLPQEYRKEGIDLLDRLDKILSTYIVGQLLVALIIGSLMFIGYLIIGMPNALLMASFSVITSVIPMIGAFLGILPALILSLGIGLDMAIKIIILSVIVQQLEGNLITPNLMGSRLKIHPFIVMVVVIVSINLMGIFGAFIGIPLYLGLSTLIKEIIKIRKKEKIKNNG